MYLRCVRFYPDNRKIAGGYDVIVIGRGSQGRVENVHIVLVFGAGTLDDLPAHLGSNAVEPGMPAYVMKRTTRLEERSAIFVWLCIFIGSLEE